MNRRGLHHFQVTLGVMQLAVVLGLVTGSLACAFYLGFFSGQQSGYERAFEGTRASVARLPVFADAIPKEVAREGASAVYEKIMKPGSDRSAIQVAVANNIANGAKDEAAPASAVLPSLAPIKSVLVEETARESTQLRAENEAAVGGDTTRAQIGVVKEPDSGATSKVEQRAVSAARTVTLGALVPPIARAEHEEIRIENPAKKEVEGVQKVGVIPATAAPVPPVPLSRDQKSDAQVPVTKREGTERIPARSALASGQLPSGGAPTNRALSTNPAPGELAPADRANVSLVRQVIPKGWFAQVAAPKKLGEAEALAKNLKGSGFSVMIENANVRGEEYFRVLVGPEEGRTQAERLVAQLKREDGVKGEPFLRAVK